MLSGWTLLATHCPICNSALLRKQNQTKCAFCNMPVLIESDYEGRTDYEDNAATNKVDTNNNAVGGVGGVGGVGTSSPQSQYYTDRSWMFREATEASRPATSSNGTSNYLNTSPVTRGSPTRTGLSSDDSEDSRVDDRKLSSQQPQTRSHIHSFRPVNVLPTHPLDTLLTHPLTLTYPRNTSSLTIINQWQHFTTSI